ncbi:MAG TPA: ribonuclease III [Alphaproteobacteria bacterium]|nr:ribonuclease III [Alphaproteobacteria bacterium]
MTEPRQGDLADLAQALGHVFARPELLREAMTHPSIDPDYRGGARFGYERLEFLGDRVLGLVVAQWLLELYPAEPEGALARRHTGLVRRETLAAIAATLGLGRYLLLSSGEEVAGGRDNRAILADACEAVIAALYLDGGLKAAEKFIRSAFTEALHQDAPPPQDAKTALQEWAQARGKPLPRYETVSRSGPDHDPVFEVRVEVEGLASATASGPSKRAAAKEAAARMLAALSQS